MNLQTLFAAPPSVVAHAMAAMGALALGLVQLAAPKGTLPHRTLGYVWVALMATVVVTSFLMIGTCAADGLSLIHILSVVTAVALVGLVRDARAGRVAAHRSTAFWLVFAALIGAGLFTLTPGRLMHDVVFGTSPVQYGCQ